MEQTSEPGYGQVVSPDGAAWTAVSGEPDVEHTGPSNRDDARSQEQAGSGSLEEQARSLLEGCEGMEPPYEWMSVEGSPDRTEHELTAGHVRVQRVNIEAFHVIMTRLFRGHMGRC